MKITRDTWDELLGYPDMKFETFCGGAYCKTKVMKSQVNFSQIRYLEPQDIVDVVKKRIEGQLNVDGRLAKSNRKKWLKLAEKAQKLIDKTVQYDTEKSQNQEKNMQGMDGIIKFQKDRGLDKKDFDHLNETANIIEELLEAAGYDIPKESRKDFKDEINNFFARAVEIEGVTYTDPTEEDKVDAFNDIIVFSAGAILKLGYNPLLTTKEVSKEINSRAGQMVDGKFEKDLSKAAQLKWYKADYSTCKS